MKIQRHLNKKARPFFVYIAIFVLAFAFVPMAQAAPVTTVSDTMSRLKVGQDSNHTIQFTTPTGVAAGQNITITFPSDFSTTTVDYTDIDVLDDGSQLTLAGTASGTTWGAAFGGTGSRTLTISSQSGSIAAASVVVVRIGTNATQGATGDQAINNPTTNNTFIITIAGSFGDTGSIAVAILLDEQIPVTASVNPTITFTVDTTTLALGIIDTATVATTTANNISIGTNVAGGYTITVSGYGNGTNDGLYNSSYNKLIASSTATLTGGAEGYGGQCQTSGTPSGSCAAAYNHWADQQVGELGVAPATFASYGAKPAATDTFQIRVKAAISTTTDPGSYADTLTLIGTVNY